MNMPKSRDIQAKMPSSKVIYASNESKSVLARNLEECRDNDKNSQSVILLFKCILARNCEGTEQLRMQIKSIVISAKCTVRYGFSFADNQVQII